MENWLKNNWWKIILATGVLLIGFSIFYYYVIFLPKKEQTRVDLQKQELLIQITREKEKQENEERQAQTLDNCLNEAEWRYKKLQEFLFQEGDKPGCKSNLACLKVNEEKREEIKIDLKDEKEECFKLYGK